MGSGGSTQRRAPYRSHSTGSYRNDEPLRARNSARVVSQHNITPRIVVHGTPYMDRPDAYGVRQKISARSQTHMSTPKRSVAAISHTSMLSPLACPQASSTMFAIPPQPSESPQPLSQVRPPPAKETCNCRLCKEKEEALAAYRATSSAATSTYVAAPSNQCPPAATTQTRAIATVTPKSMCTGGTRIAREQVLPATTVYAGPQRTTSARNLSTTCGAPNCRGHFECRGDRYADRSYSNRNISAYVDTTTRMRQTSVATQNQAARPPATLCYDEAAQTSGGATSESAADFQQECLEAHNQFRARHKNCPPLALSNELSRYAQQWAKHLASTGRLEHRQVHTYGENLYTSYGKEVNGTTAVQNWYDEVRYYDFSNPNYKPGTGHFTQVVWRESRQLGVGIATRGETTYVVCNYNPPGNIIGTFDSMVPPLK